MRIFLSFLQSIETHDIPPYRHWEAYLKKGIEEAGQEWIEAEEVDWAEGLVYSDREALEEWRERTWNRALSYIKRQHQIKPVYLFLSYLYPKQIEPIAVQEIKALSIPCVNFFCDNVREFVRVPDEFYCFDLHWVPEFTAIKMYQRARLNYVHAPMPTWVPAGQRTCEHPENYGVSFIGSSDSQREVLFAQAINLGAPLEIRGAGWTRDDAMRSPQKREGKGLWRTAVNQASFLQQHGIQPWFRKVLFKFRPQIPDNTFDGYIRKRPNALEYIEITQQSKITLGVNRYPSYRYPFSKPDTYSRLRDLEAPMMGACYLTEWAEGLDQLYELGDEIEAYRTAEEMVEKIHRLEADFDKRQRMRRQGQKRALADHTIAKSIDKISAALGLSK